MSDYPRHAIYFVPDAESALYRFGAAALGYDGFSDADQNFLPGLEGAVPDWRELTIDPRKYGFHATLKAPFALRDGQTEDALVQACTQFAAAPRVIPVIAPVIDSLEGFIALVPQAAPAELSDLAQACVEAFEPFRAPLMPLDRERRNPAALTQRQRDYLDRWGYPYVAEEFRFHMTLTGRLPAERRPDLLGILREHFVKLDLSTIEIGAIALLRQDDARAHFRVVSHHQLTRVS